MVSYILLYRRLGGKTATSANGALNKWRENDGEACIFINGVWRGIRSIVGMTRLKRAMTAGRAAGRENRQPGVNGVA